MPFFFQTSNLLATLLRERSREETTDKGRRTGKAKRLNRRTVGPLDQRKWTLGHLDTWTLGPLIRYLIKGPSVQVSKCPSVHLRWSKGPTVLRFKRFALPVRRPLSVVSSRLRSLSKVASKLEV